VFGTVYAKVCQSARAGGPPAGALFWQLPAEGMDSYRDEYEVVLGRAPSSIVGVLAARRPGHVGGAMMRRDRGPGGVLGVAV
jgi:mannan endo-1,4-beta-mannosidase